MEVSVVFSPLLTLFGWLVVSDHSSYVCACQVTLWRTFGCLSRGRGVVGWQPPQSHLSRGWVQFSSAFGLVRLTMAPHGSPYYKSLLHRWLRTRRESVIHLSKVLQFLLLDLPWQKPHTSSMGGSSGRTKCSLKHKICITFVLTPLLASDLKHGI